MSRDQLQDELLAELLRQSEQADRAEAVFGAGRSFTLPPPSGP